MDTVEVLKSLQRWLQAGRERASRGNTPAGEGPPFEGAGGDEVPSPELLDAGPRTPKVDGDLFCALRGIQDVVLLSFGKPVCVSVSTLLDGIKSIVSARAGIQMSRVDATGGVAVMADDLASRDLSYVCFIGNPMSRGWPSAYVKPWIAGTMEMPKPDPASNLWNLLYTSFYVLAHETNHPKDPDAVQRGTLSRLSTALVLLPAQGWVAGCHWKWRRSAGDGNNCLATERCAARWCSCGGIV
jgi:hypothetical protein